MLVLLFIGNRTTSRDYLESMSFTTGTATDEIFYVEMPCVGMGSNINPLAPESVHSYVKSITSLMYSGPRLATHAFRSLCQASRLRRLDVEGGAAVLGALFRQGSRLPFQEMVATIPGRDPARIFRQLADLPGVLFLKSDPPGLTLSSELRQEMSRAVGGQGVGA